ncbi:MAG: type II secretion system protein N, partial [Aquincola tertiaricarbonis]
MTRWNALRPRRAARLPATLAMPETGRPHRARRWAVLGATLGLLAGVVAFAPAAWLSRALSSA